MKHQRDAFSTFALWIGVALVCVAANCFVAVRLVPILIPFCLAVLIAAMLLQILSSRKLPGRRLMVCGYGTTCLVLFLASTCVSVLYHLIAVFTVFRGQWAAWAVSAAICVCVEAIVFWIGILSVYCTSVQLGVKQRVLGVVFGMIPIAHLVMLGRIIRITSDEIAFESEKYRINQQRRDARVCRTKYPILLVHGVFFRDFQYFNYWGRIPKELIENGATVYYGEHQSAASIEESAEELADRIRRITQETGCEKVNIIAHSKGGLDCRYAITHMGVAERIASLTTINTPHRGCKFADYLLEKMPSAAVNKIANTYNSALKKLGDDEPDFLAAVRDLTSGRCTALDQELPQPAGIVCASVGSKLNRATGGKFPLNCSYHLVKYFDGANDGLVGEASFRWGDGYTFLTTEGKRGISHGDMIDLNRENLPGFDVREFYVQLVSDLARQGL